jgi:hypothetical protein
MTELRHVGAAETTIDLARRERIARSISQKEVNDGILPEDHAHVNIWRNRRG